MRLTGSFQTSVIQGVSSSGRSRTATPPFSSGVVCGPDGGAGGAGGWVRTGGLDTPPLYDVPLTAQSRC